METQKSDTSVLVAEAGENAETTVQQMTNSDEFELFVGDYIEFTAGPKVGTKGMIYFLDDELLRVLPDGASDRLVDIETSIFADENTRMKRDPTSLNSFVEIADLKEGNAVQTFDANGTAVTAYKVESINKEEDSVVLLQIDGEGTETGERENILFTEDGRVRGIPLDAPFAVLRAQEMPKPPLSEEEEKDANTEAEEEEVLLEQVLEEVEDDADQVIQARKAEEIIYDDAEQKNDFIEMERAALNPEKRNSVKELQRIRRLMESCIQLRNDILEYKESGRVDLKPVVYQTLAALLNSTNFPLAKQVLRVYRTLYLDVKEEGVEDPTLDLQVLEEAVDGGIAFLEEQYKKRTAEGEGIQTQLPRLYTALKQFFENYFRVIGPMKGDAIKSSEFDRDFFRLNVPIVFNGEELDTKQIVKGISNVGDKFLGTNDIRPVSFSYMRTIKSRIGKYGEKRRKIIGPIEEGDEAEAWLFVLFPFLFLRDLGAIRSGKFALDVGNSFSNPKTMKMILDEAGGIKTIHTPGDIIVIDADGQAAGNIELEHWLKAQSLYGNGIGDLLPYLKSIGLDSAEFTPDQQYVLLKKIQFYQANLKTFLKEIRQQANEILRNPQPVKNFSLLSQEEQAKFFELLTGSNESNSEKILMDKIDEFKKKYPSWQNNDLGIFSYLYTHYPDYVLASISGIPQFKAEERKRVVDDTFLESLRQALAYQKKASEEGEPPLINECDHVKNLADIRKIDDDDQRIQVMVRKFLPMFQGRTEDHWIHCKVCKSHLICEHEYLMILEKTHPVQKDQIHKQILLNFGDGVFNGKFICGNCGQPIQQLEFDRETNDDGKALESEPLSEQAETAFLNELENLLDIQVRVDEIKEATKKTVKPEEQSILTFLGEMCNALGVQPGETSLSRMLRTIQRLVQNRQYKTSADWDAYQKRQKEKSTQKQVFPTFQEFVNEDILMNCAAVLFVEIQSAVPDFTIRSGVSGCGDITFQGYPLNTDNSKKDGLEYISCAIATLVRDEKPWGETFLARAYRSKDPIPNRKKRIFSLLSGPYIEKVIAEAEMQGLLEKKRAVLLKEKGERALTGRHAEDIPSDFLPAPIVLTEEQLKRAEAPTIGDAATPTQRAYAWLLEGYRLAKLNGVYDKANPFSEVSCCYSTIQDPLSFWITQSLPALPKKLPPQGPRGSMLLLKLDLRKQELLLGEPNPRLMYRLFLRVCFPREGIVNPRVGLPHEPGYDNKCPYCQFEFPVDPRLPPPQLSYSKSKSIQGEYDKEYQTEVQSLYDKEIGALQAAGVVQGVTVEKETFETLLQATNSHFIIPPLTRKSVATDLQTLEGLLSLNPEPFDGFQETIQQLIREISALAKNADAADVRVAYGPISGTMSSNKEEIETVFKRDKANEKLVLIEWQTLWNASPQNLGEMLRTFLLLPLQRVLNETRFEFNDLVHRENAVYSVISRDEKETLMGYLSKHLGQVKAIQTILERLGDRSRQEVCIKKIKELVERLTVVIPLFIKVLRSNVVPFGAIGLPYLQRSILAGMLWDFINPDALGGKDTLYQILRTCFLKAQEKDEKTMLSSEEIRKFIAARSEGEKVEIINEFDKMDPEEKRAELMMKSLKLGRWARGGKGILTYDAVQMANELAERQRRGIEDWQGAQEATDGYDTYARDGEEGDD